MTSAAFDVLRFDRVTSTNEVALELARTGARDRTLLVAAEQTAGRGRHGRRWHSPRGNFYSSLILRCDRPLGEAATLSLVLGLVVLQAIAQLADRRLALALKWPNDVLLAGAKVAGILLEAGSDGSREPGAIIAGVGVNLVSHPDSAPYPTTNLAAAGLAMDPDRFLAAYVQELDRELATWERDGFAMFRDRWLEHASGIGSPATLRVGDSSYSGRMIGIGDDGTLALETVPGGVEHFTAGELFFAGGGMGLSEPGDSR